MKNKEHLTAFYLETLLLIVVFVGIILVLTQVFGLSRKRSGEALALNSAVCLSQNAAEAFLAAETEEEFVSLLNENGNAAEQEENCLTASYDLSMNPDPKGEMVLSFTWKSEENGVTYGSCRVLWEGKEIYSLETGAAGKEGWE